MQSPTQVLDSSFLDIRHALLEIAAFFDRYDAVVNRDGCDTGHNDPRCRLLQDATKILADEGSHDRAELLLNLFSEQ